MLAVAALSAPSRAALGAPSLARHRADDCLPAGPPETATHPPPGVDAPRPVLSTEQKRGCARPAAPANGNEEAEAANPGGRDSCPENPDYPRVRTFPGKIDEILGAFRFAQVRALEPRTIPCFRATLS